MFVLVFLTFFQVAFHPAFASDSNWRFWNGCAMETYQFKSPEELRWEDETGKPANDSCKHLLERGCLAEHESKDQAPRSEFFPISSAPFASTSAGALTSASEIPFFISAAHVADKPTAATELHSASAQP